MTFDAYEGKYDPITLAYDVPLFPEAAMFVFVTESKLWWPHTFASSPSGFEGVIIQPRIGGAVASVQQGKPEPWGKVEVFEPGKEIVISSWLLQSWETPTQVRVTFDHIDEGTRVVLTHGGWTSDNVHHKDRFEAWPLVMSGYVTQTRKHVSERSRIAQFRK